MMVKDKDFHQLRVTSSRALQDNMAMAVNTNELYLENYGDCQGLEHTPAILALKIRRQQDHHEFKASLGHTAKPCLKKKITEGR